MRDAISLTLCLLAIIVFVAAPRYAKAYRSTGNKFGLVAMALCFGLGIWLLVAAGWLFD
jgi:hypothetical protein